MRPGLILRHEQTGRPAQSFVRRIAEHALRAAAEKADRVGRIHADNGVAGRIGDRLEARLAFLQCRFRLASLLPFARFHTLALHRRGQAPEIAFHHVVVCAVAHQLDRRHFLDDSRDYDEGNVEPALQQQFQGLGRAEARHVEIRQHDVPGLRLQRVAHRRRGVYTLMRDREAGLLQLVHHQTRITG